MLLVRDDFFMSVHRLFQELDKPMAEGRNYTVQTDFDISHARRTFTLFGHAFGRRRRSARC